MSRNEFIDNIISFGFKYDTKNNYIYNELRIELYYDLYTIWISKNKATLFNPIINLDLIKKHVRTSKLKKILSL